MAEFPELGKSCSLEACRKLDFTPFFCDTCKKYFCDAHRFDHGCQFICVEQSTTSCCNNSKPLKPYLCSMDRCFSSEIIRIDCQDCGLNFCLKHRHPEEHKCHSKRSTNKQIDRDCQEELKKKMAVIIAADRKDIAEASVPPSTQNKKLMDETTRRRAERIAIMRLKSNIRNFDIPAAEQMFLFVTENQKREPVMVSKHWTIGRCLDQIAKQCSVPNSNAAFGNKVLRLYCETDQINPLPMSENVQKYLKDSSNVFLKRDD